MFFNMKPRATGVKKGTPKKVYPHAPDGMKYCTICEKIKLISEFNKNSTIYDGISNQCKFCHAIYKKNWKRMKEYGLTSEDIDVMLLSQDNMCSICNKDISNKFHIDHNHSTGKTRGLLCRKCNMGLGHFKNNPDAFRIAADYLELHQLDSELLMSFKVS